MPKHQISIAIPGMDTDTALACASLTMQQLSWPVQYAGENSIVGKALNDWKSPSEQVACYVTDGQLIVVSEMIKGELVDLTGKNKKNCRRFNEAFEKIKATTDQSSLEDVKASIAVLRETTKEKIVEEEQEAKEIDAAMNLSGSNLYVTYAIIAINVIIFALMALDGAGIIDANGYVHLKWGSNYGPLTLSGDWWRLISNVFIHFGIIHLAMNMYCLYSIAIYLEPMLGKIRYAAVYLCTGILASIVSLWWHKEPANSAGASGAVFGMYGVFLALLTSNLIPKGIRQSLLQSIAIFVGYNLLYGLKGGIDNAAHIGGLVSGFVLGYGYVFAIRKEKTGQSLTWMVPAIVVLTAGISVYYLQENKAPESGRASVLNDIKASSYKDHDRFNKALEEFDKIHAEVDGALSDTALNYAQLAGVIDKTALPQYEKISKLVNDTKSYDISDANHQKANLLLEYIELKKEEMQLMKNICLGGSEEQIVPELNRNREKAANKFQEIVKL